MVYFSCQRHNRVINIFHANQIIGGPKQNLKFCTPAPAFKHIPWLAESMVALQTINILGGVLFIYFWYYAGLGILFTSLSHAMTSE